MVLDFGKAFKTFLTPCHSLKSPEEAVLVLLGVQAFGERRGLGGWPGAGAGATAGVLPGEPALSPRP